jgi:hypothetical protein
MFFSPFQWSIRIDIAALGALNGSFTTVLLYIMSVSASTQVVGKRSISILDDLSNNKIKYQ